MKRIIAILSILFLAGTAFAFPPTPPAPSGGVRTVTVAATKNLTAGEMTGQTVLVTDAYTVSLPTAVVGQKAKLVATTAKVFSVDVVTATDIIYLNQTAFAAGEMATSDGTIRATISCECVVTGIYDCVTNRGLFINGG